MARKKKTEQPTTPEPTPATAKVMAQTMWRRWGAPAWIAETRSPLVVPSQMHFEVLDLGTDEIIAVHPISGVRILMRRGMITLV